MPTDYPNALSDKLSHIYWLKLSWSEWWHQNALSVNISHIYRWAQKAVVMSVMTSGLQLKIKLDQITAAYGWR